MKKIGFNIANLKVSLIFSIHVFLFFVQILQLLVIYFFLFAMIAFLFHNLEVEYLDIANLQFEKFNLQPSS